MKVTDLNVLICLQYFIDSTENYPETLKAAYIINASKVFKLVFGIMKVIYGILWLNIMDEW